MKKLLLPLSLLGISCFAPKSVRAQTLEEMPTFKAPANFRAVANVGEIRRGDQNPLAKARAYYPQFKSKAIVARYAGFVLRRAAQKDVSDFMAMAAKDLKEFTPIPGTAYTFSQTPGVHFYHPARLVSTSAMTSYYTGGAHGMYQTTTRNFGLVPGESRPRQLQLADFFAPGFNYRAHVDKKLLAKLRANKEQEATWVKIGEVKTLAPMLANFAVEADGLRWFFPPYAVGPYAAGEFETKLNLAELGPNFKKSWLVAR